MLIANVDSSQISLISVADDLGKIRTFKEISNKRFGKLVALTPLFLKVGAQKEGEYKATHNIVKKRTELWHCKCDCGNSKVASYDNLIWGHVTSCGCQLRIHPKKRAKNYQYIQVKMTREDGSKYDANGIVFLEGGSSRVPLTP